MDKCPCWFSCRARCQVPTTLAVIKVQGDGDCLFHALAFCSGSDGGALRIEVADFLEEEALNQAGFEEAWLEEADKIRRSEWGGHTAITAYSLMTKRRVIVHTREMDGGTKVEEQSHEQLMEKPGAKQIHILYNGNDHYDALVQVVDPSGMEPAWPQPPPPTYFKQAEEAFPSLHEATSIDNKKRPDRPRFTTARPSKKAKAKNAQKPVAIPEEHVGEGDDETNMAVPLKRRRIVGKTTPPPELRDDILTELTYVQVRRDAIHPHRRAEQMIQDLQAMKQFYAPSPPKKRKEIVLVSIFLVKINRQISIHI